MSISNVMAFYKNVQNNAALQAKLTTIFEKEQALYTENIVKLATEVGYELKNVDLEQLALEDLEQMGEAGELNDEKLEAITGGHNAAHVIKVFIENTTGIKISIPITSIFR